MAPPAALDPAAASRVPSAGAKGPGSRTPQSGLDAHAHFAVVRVSRAEGE
ncbi:hypothetical protein AB0M94_36085 [Streptomyces xanthochromogenes]